MNNIKVIRLGQTLNWEHGFNCSLKKYNGIDKIVDFSDYLKRVFDKKSISLKHRLKYSHCRIFHKSNFVEIYIYLQDLDFIDNIMKKDVLRKKFIGGTVKKVFKGRMINRYFLWQMLRVMKQNLKLQTIKKKERNLKYISDYKLFKISNDFSYLKKKPCYNIKVFLENFSEVYIKNISILKKKKTIKNNKLLKYILNLRLFYKKKIEKIFNKYIYLYKLNKKIIKKKNFSIRKRAIVLYEIYLHKRFIKEKKLVNQLLISLSGMVGKKKKDLFKNILEKNTLEEFCYIRNKNLRYLENYGILQAHRFLQVEDCLLKASMEYYKKKVFFRYCILDNYIITSNIIVKYICERLKQGFFLGEILKDVDYVLKNSRDVIGFRIDCAGRFGRKQRTSFKRLSVGKLLKSKINAIIDYSMDFVILKYGCCNVKVLINKREDYREFRYKFSVF